MVSRKLLGVWAFLDLCLLASGAIALTFSLVWRAPNLLRNMVFSHADLTAGLALGISLLITFAISVGAIIQANHVTIGLVILNWVLVLDGLGVVVVGTFVWFYTLQERSNFKQFFTALSADQRISIQDELHCCGYYGVSDAQIGGAYCQNKTFVQTTVANQSNFCVGPITAFADRSLNLTFTTIYGYMAVIICLLLASLCVIKKRLEDERFKKIDAKRGGRGFV
jgi:hypothetical protein